MNGMRNGRRVAALILAGFACFTPMVGATSTVAASQQTAVRQSLTTSVASTAVRDSLTALVSDSMENTALFDSCKLAVSCSWGTGSKWVALYGDSHAPMWATAIVPALLSKGFRVSMNWMPGCTPAHLTVQSPSALCNTTWRGTAENNVIKAKNKPVAVIVMERTSDITLTNGKPPTKKQLSNGLATTLSNFTKAGLKVVLLGDNPVMMSGDTYSGTYLPGGCVSLHLTSLRSCDTSLAASLKFTFTTAERDAAAAAHATYIDTTPWFCSTLTQQCPSVIGNYVAYRDAGHLSFAYAATLRNLVTEALRGPLRLS